MILCGGCEKEIALGQTFLRVGYDNTGKMAVRHLGCISGTDAADEKPRILTVARVQAINSFRLQSNTNLSLPVGGEPQSTSDLSNGQSKETP